MNIPMISSQRFLDPSIIQRKVQHGRVFVVRVAELPMRGKRYRVIVDGHHNFAAAKALGVEPKFKGPSRKFETIVKKEGEEKVGNFLANNLTDSDWFFVETGEVVVDLLGVRAPS